MLKSHSLYSTTKNSFPGRAWSTWPPASIRASTQTRQNESKTWHRFAKRVEWRTWETWVPPAFQDLPRRLLQPSPVRCVICNWQQLATQQKRCVKSQEPKKCHMAHHGPQWPTCMVFDGSAPCSSSTLMASMLPDLRLGPRVAAKPMHNYRTTP